MKKINFISLISSLLISYIFISNSFSQETEKKEQKLTKIPSVDIKTMEGGTFNTSNFSNDGKPIIISFWATWCKPCIKELTTIAEVYDDWKKETGVKLIAISIDDSRRIASVSPLVNGNGWDFEVYIDTNSDFKRAMNVNLIPHTFIINGNGEIVWQHTSFAEGGELELIELIKKLVAGEDISN
jgi:thiol-disulfide isomerase/thioredoxin